MAPKSSDGETNEASSIQLQPTEAMEISAGLASSLLGKRKAETPNTSESEGDRESVDEEEEEEEEEEDSDSDWDKDSFDGRVYNPSDDDDGDYEDEEFEKIVRSYHRLVIETKGFFAPASNFPKYILAGIATIWDMEKKVNGITVREFLEEMASVCVEEYNRRKEKSVKLEQILWANYRPSGRTKYYITFSARESESPNAPLVEYQAKAVRIVGKSYPILCRPSPPRKTS